jgi:hypothetical protein
MLCFAPCHRHTEPQNRIFPSVDHFPKEPSYSLGLYLLIDVHDSLNICDNSWLIMQRTPERNETEPGSVTNVVSPLTPKATKINEYATRHRPIPGQGLRSKRVQPLLRNRPINKRPFLSNGSINMFTRKKKHAKIEERCFRCGPRRGVILKAIKLIS